MTIMKQSFTQLKERLDKKEKKIRTLEKTIAALEVNFDMLPFMAETQTCILLISKILETEDKNLSANAKQYLLR